MNGEWCYFNRRLSPEFCRNVHDLAMTLPASEAKIGSEKRELAVVDPNYRRSTLRFFERTDSRFQPFFDEMWKLAVQANEEWFGVHISLLKFAQFAEYDSVNSGEYKTHQDVFWVSKENPYHRKLSAVVQLSDPNDYEGGDLVLDDAPAFGDRDAIRAQGTVIFFPSMFRHHVTPVTKGKRCSIACWFEGPKWR